MPQTLPARTPSARAALSRVLAIGLGAVVGAALVHGGPDAAAVRRGACTLAACAAPTSRAMVAQALTAGRAGPDTASSRHP
jgi:hypothetical protein